MSHEEQGTGPRVGPSTTEIHDIGARVQEISAGTGGGSGGSEDERRAPRVDRTLARWAQIANNVDE